MIRGRTLAGFRRIFLQEAGERCGIQAQVHELQGKTLGCFCKPHPCHGDIIKEYLDRIAGRGEDIEIGTIFYKGKAYPSRKITTGMEPIRYRWRSWDMNWKMTWRNLLG